MKSITNHQYKLAKRPFGMPKPTDWEYIEYEVPELEDNQILIENLYISLDPAMRGWMNDVKSYIRPVQIGEVMRAITLGKIIDSNNQEFNKGDYVIGTNGVQSHAVSSGRGLRKFDPSLSLPLYLSILGMTGLTAYFGLLEIGKPKKGETLVVSGAAGAVGSVTGQLGKIMGCRVVGIAGSEIKCQYIRNELGFDAAINYKTEDINQGLKQHCPDGIDIYFDNVGGDILNTVLRRINHRARILISGAISQYNITEPMKGPSNYMSLLINRARMEGFLVTDYYKQYTEAIKQLETWYSSGKINSKEHIVEGIKSFPETFIKLFSGDKMGKLIIKVINS